MRKATQWMAVVGVVVLFGFGYLRADDDACVRVEVIPVKAAFCSGAPVIVDVRIRVDCGPAVLIPSLLEVEGNLDILITAPSGASIRHMTDHRRVFALSREAFLRLRPDHFFGRRVEISPRHFETAGTYGLRVVYGNDDDGERLGIAAWTGLVKSNRVAIHVVREGNSCTCGEDGTDSK